MILGVGKSPWQFELGKWFFFLYQNLGVPLPFSDTLRKAFSQGSGIVLGIMFLFPFVPSTFHAMCSNLELEAAISTVFAAFWVWTSHFPWYLQHVGAQTVHVTWQVATGVHLGWFSFLWVVFRWLGLCRAFLRVGLRFFWVGWGLVHLGLVSWLVYLNFV